MSDQMKMGRAELLRHMQKLYPQVETHLHGLVNEIICLVLNAPASTEFRQVEMSAAEVVNRLQENAVIIDSIKSDKQLVVANNAISALEDISAICQKFFGTPKKF